MATGPLGDTTNPRQVPLSYCRWLAVHSWLGDAGSWHVVGIWKACCTPPDELGLVAVTPEGFHEVTRRELVLKPSPRPSSPNRLSKEWFSSMSTTMCSISGSVSVPGGRFGKGTESGYRRADRPRAARAAAAPGGPGEAVKARSARRPRSASAQPAARDPAETRKLRRLTRRIAPTTAGRRPPYETLSRGALTALCANWVEGPIGPGTDRD